MYLVMQQKVYRHAIKGIYRNLEEAKRRAMTAIEEESDHFHGTAVIAVKEGIPIEDGRVVAGYSWHRDLGLVLPDNRRNIEYRED